MAVLAAGLFTSCEQTTGSSAYDSQWSPFENTTWNITYPYGASTMMEDFIKTNGGIKFKAFVADTGAYTYTFIPSGMYVVSNIETAKSAALSFTVKITSAQDTIALQAGGNALHTFGSLSGSVQTKGPLKSDPTKIDTVFTLPVAFTTESASFLLKHSPDSCSRQFKITLKVDWKAFIGGTPAGALPKNKKLNIEFSNIVMRAEGVTILK